MEKLRYFIKEGFRNIWANHFMSLAAMGVLAVCLLLLGSTVLVSRNVGELVTQIEGKNQIMVYLKDGLSQSQIDSVGDSIKNMENVKQVTFVSKEQALQNEKARLGSEAQLLDGLENDNPYPNSYQVQLVDMKNYDGTVNAIKKLSGVEPENIGQNSDVARQLNNISGVIRVVGIWVFIILAIVSLFIIAYTIKLTVFVRRREVNIMKFVGATDWFIRWPFVIEGFIIGVLAGIIGFGVQWYLYKALISQLFMALKVAPIPFSSMAGILCPGFLLSGVLIGIVGSVISVHKYLQV